jgi:hypothetical protein
MTGHRQLRFTIDTTYDFHFEKAVLYRCSAHPEVRDFASIVSSVGYANGKPIICRKPRAQTSALREDYLYLVLLPACFGVSTYAMQA